MNDGVEGGESNPSPRHSGYSPTERSDHLFRRYENASLSYTGIESHPDLDRVGGYDTVVTLERITDVADG